MRFVLAMTVISLVIGTSAQSADLKYTCTHGDTIRTVEAVSQTDSVYSCVVRYQQTSIGAQPKVIYHAVSGTSFCEDRAKAWAAGFGRRGWTCAQGETGAVANSPQPYAVPLEVGRAVIGDDVRAAGAGVTGATHPAETTAVPHFELRGPILR